MYGTNEFFYYLSQFDSYLRSQQQQIRRMRAELNELQNQVKEFREKPTTNIERIEYKFDQLKIETLEGTLNIGLTPNGMPDSEPFEQFSVGQTSNSTHLPILQQYPDLYPRLQKELQHFLSHDCQHLIDESAKKYNINLDGPHKNFIIQDIERQLEERIHNYLKQSAHLRNANEETIEEHILGEVKKDISNAIDIFIKHLPKGGDF